MSFVSREHPSSVAFRLVLGAMALMGAGCPKHDAPSETSRAQEPTSERSTSDADTSNDVPAVTKKADDDGATSTASWVESIRAERWEEAEAAFSRASDDERNKPEAKLARARVLRMLGKEDEAVKLLGSLDDALPLVRDVIAKERALDAMKVGPADKAAEWLGAESKPGSWLLAAEAWERAGNTPRARTEYERVIASSKHSLAEETRARTARLRILSDAKNDAEGLVDARWLAIYALDEDAATKAEGLVEHAKPPKPLTIEELLTRARTLAENGRDEAALRAVERASKATGPSKLSKIDRCRARAEVLYKARTRYSEAAAAYRTCAEMKSPRSAEDAFLSARALSRADRDSDALTAFALVAQRYPKTTWADQAEFHIARTHALAGSWSDAARAFDTYAQHWPTGKEKAEANRYRAIAHLMNGDFKLARKLLEELAGDAKDPNLQARWTNLAAFAALQDGDRLHAVARWSEVARSQPASFPALVARARLASLSAPIPPMFETAFETAPQTANAPPLEVVLPPPADMLHRIGFDDEAEKVLRDREGVVVGHAGSREIEALCNAYGAIDRGKRRYQISRRLPATWIQSAPSKGNLFAWNCVFPRPHASHVRAAAKESGVSPSLIWAVMRQESAFDPEVVSPARAVGLMQLMPRTANTVAKTNGLPHDEAWLVLPGHNIALGTRYLRELTSDFAGNVPLAVASYNAGPEAIRRWKARAKGETLDVFVETIPFLETREYVVRVLGNCARYEILEGGESSLSALPLSLDEVKILGP